MRGKRLSAKAKSTINFYLYILPWIVGFSLFTLVPMGSSLYYAFHNVSFISMSAIPPEFIGWKNFAVAFQDSLFLASIGNTFYFATVKTVVGLAVSLLIALLVDVRFVGNKAVRVLVYLPAIIPMVASTMVWAQLFSSDFSLLNYLLSLVGIPPIDWLSYPNAMQTVLLMSIWGSLGPTMLMLLATLQGVPQELVEAAQLDGCPVFRRFFKIILPMISPTIFYLLITNLIGGLQAYAEMELLVGIGTDKTLTMAWNVVMNAFNLDGFKTMGYASAQAWILFLIIMVFTLVFFRFSKRFVYYAGE